MSCVQPVSRRCTICQALAHLQDHLGCYLRCEINEPLTIYGMSADELRAAQRECLEQGTGPFATNLFEAAAFARSCRRFNEDSDTHTDLDLHQLTTKPRC